MTARALGFVALLALTACGTAARVDSSSSSSSPSSTVLDRSDPEQVAVAMVTAILESDYDTVRRIVRPDQLADVAAVEQAATLGSAPEVEIVSVTATVLDDDGTTAHVTYSGEYCLPATTGEITVTSVGSGNGQVDPVPGSDLVGGRPARCLDLDEVFGADPVELTRIEGQWYAPLPG